MERTPKQYSKLINKIITFLNVIILPIIVIDAFLYKYSGILNFEYGRISFTISLICIFIIYGIITAFVFVYLVPYCVHFDMIEDMSEYEYHGKISLKDFDKKVKEYQTIASNELNKGNICALDRSGTLISLYNDNVDYCSSNSIYLRLRDIHSQSISYCVNADYPKLDGKSYHLSFFDFLKFRKQIKKGKYDIFTQTIKNNKGKIKIQGEG